jgi:hypothetical protein
LSLNPNLFQMKKNLLSISLVLTCAVAFSQSSPHARPGSPVVHARDYKHDDKAAPVQNASRSTHAASARHVNPNHSSGVCNVVALGSAANALGASGGGRTQVWYDQDLNTVVFTHRGECGVPSAVTNSGFYVYDYSTDGGTTWSINQGPMYGVASNTTTGCTALGPHRGRFPTGVIFNPAGNTDPNNAHIVYTGPWNTEFPTGTTNWYGQVYGVGHINGTPAIEHYDSLPNSASWPDDLFITKQGVAWKLGDIGDQTTNFSFLDTLGLYKGIWNGSDFTYTYYPIHYTTNPDIVDAAGNPAGITDYNIAFGDDGMTGYIALITNQDAGNANYPDTTFYMQVLKTIDGGQTWSCPMDLDIRTCLDSAMVGQGSTIYASSWDLDLVVDKNNNPHIVNTIVPKAGPGSVFLGYEYKSYGIFDFYSTDQGQTYKAQLLAHPQTYAGQFGTAGVDQVTEFQRPFVCRTWDGSKLYYGWFDTDTATFGILTNNNPDLHLMGYDVDGNMYTEDLSVFSNVGAGENITAGSNADGACTFGNGPYYAKEGGPTPSVPVSYMVVGNTGLDVSLPCDFFYVDCATPSGTLTHPGHPLDVTTHYLSPLCADGSGTVLTTNDLSKDLLVSGNYPNPYTGKTSVDVSLAKAMDVTIEISNVVGQTLVSASYKNLHTGMNTLTIDGSALSQGLYFYTVKAGANSVTKTMTVE